MSGNIFISYRRSDSTKDARALYERLRREFGEERVFVDLEGIEPGEDFVLSLERQLDGCEVLVILIGRDWAEARNEDGERRLDDENDFVRIELRAALSRGIKVFPVLIDGALPPKAAQLPEELRSLVRRQAMSLDYSKFDADVAQLARAIHKALKGPSIPGLTGKNASSSGLASAQVHDRIAAIEASPPTSQQTNAAQVLPETISPQAQSSGRLPSMPSTMSATTPEAGLQGPKSQAAVAAERADALLAADVRRPPQPIPTEAPNGIPRLLPAVLVGAVFVGALLLVIWPKDSPSPSGRPEAPSESLRVTDQVTSAEIQAAYDKFKAQASGVEYRVRHILVDGEDAAKAMIKQINGGAKFEDVASRNSKDPGSAANGGDLDFNKPDAYVPEFGQSIVKLKKGEMTQEPVKTSFGYHIIKLEDTRQAQFPPLEEVKGQIEEQLRLSKNK